MKIYLRTIVVAVFFIAVFILTFEISAEAQGRRARQRRANQQPSTTVPVQKSANTGKNQTAGSQTLRRVYSVNLSSAQITSLRSIPGLLKVVTIKGRTVKPRAGSSLWALTNGAHVLFGQGDQDADPPLASEWIFRPLVTGGIYYAACTCGNQGGGADDGCKFNGPPQINNCEGPSCCGFRSGVIREDGTMTVW